MHGSRARRGVRKRPIALRTLEVHLAASGNTVCGGEVSIDIEAQTEASVTDNEVCE